MTYEGQVAGVPDAVPTAARPVAGRAPAQGRCRWPSSAYAAARSPTRCADVTDLEFWNAGGSGSVEASAADPVVTEVAAGSGPAGAAACSTTTSSSSRGPAAFFGLPVARRPSPRWPPSHGGGLIASGPAGADRLPTPWAPAGLHLTGLEGAGEVQTPLTGHPRGAAGDRRPGVVPARQVGRAVRARQRPCTCSPGSEFVDTVPSYRGLRPGLLSVGRRGPVLDLVALRPPGHASARAGWSASTGRPAPARPRSLPRSPRLAPAAPVVVHMDDLYDGWDGLPRSTSSSDTLLAPLAAGAPGRYRRYDWHAAAYAETRDRAARRRCWSSRASGRAPRRSPTWSRRWSGSRRPPTCGWRAGRAGRRGDAPSGCGGGQLDEQEHFAAHRHAGAGGPRVAT